MDHQPPTNMQSTRPPGKRRRKWLLWSLVSVLLLIAAILVVSLRLALHLAYTVSSDSESLPPIPPGYVDDASRLNQTKVHAVASLPVAIEQAERRLALLLEQARLEGRRVSIAGARHSMGGHTIYPGGIAINTLSLNAMKLDLNTNTLHVEAGALWKDIIVYLDTFDRSVAVMQSNNSFSVGGSISVNCHGWQFGRPPIASTVRSFRLMKADGTIVRCSREENAELFSLVLGGYGLFGIILDVDLEVVPNRRYRREQIVVPADQSLAAFDEVLQEHPDVSLIYARMNVSADQFLNGVILSVFHDEPAADGSLPPLQEPGMTQLRRLIFRGSADSEYGKRLRWDAETELQPLVAREFYSRNQLLNEGVEVFENRSSDTTDILHEYFLPRHNVAAFVLQLRNLIPRHGGNLLNVTVRSVDRDDDSFLRYADRPMLSLVMLFVQPRTAAGEAKMQRMTREMIDAAISLGGRYYLPYRLHATREQFNQAYPQAEEFFALKRKYDPDELFQNQFYLRYGMSQHVGAKAN